MSSVKSPPMSYLPGTKLSSLEAGLHATVLTDAKVMMTQGLGAGQIIKLEDWLILAGENILMSTQAQPQVQVQEQVQAQEKVHAQKPVAIGSKFRWDLNHENYRVAIMTNKGLLQVKSVTNGMSEKDAVGRVKTSMFADEAAWRSSLPKGDAVIELVGPDTRSQIQKRLEAPLRCRFSNPSDGDKLNEFMERFKIRSDVITRSSPNEMVKLALRSVENLRAELNNITMEEELVGMKRHNLNLSLNRALRLYSHHNCKSYKSQNPDVGVTYLYIRRTNRLCTNIDGTEYEVGLKSDHLNATQIVIRTATSKHSPAILYNTFKEMGNPKFYIIYRKRRIDLPL